jgi:katanin p60 ATPase-containing subunit A1
MAIDLSGDRARTIEALARKAEELYQSGQDAAAARSYEQAAKLLVMHAESAPSRSLEVARKNRALKFRQYASRLRSGDVPEGEGRAEPVVTRGPGEPKRGAEEKGKEAEHSSAVSALVHKSAITFDQIGGLSETKREIKYALGVGLAKKPEGLQLESWRNWLFYGPPGTGKTLLAAATSNLLDAGDQNRAVFFNVKVSSVMSKYFGESTKIVSELYGTARDCSPSVVFLDEFESLCGSREDGDSGTERRILSTILSELDGLSEKGREDIFVLTIAATNRPWDLDPAVLSRFDKKICIPLPDVETRRAILGLMVGKRGFEHAFELDDLLPMTEGLSGREIERLVKEVTNRMVMEENRDIERLVANGLDAVRRYEVRVRPLRLEDFERARHKVNPVTSAADMKRYAEWRESSEQ